MNKFRIENLDFCQSTRYGSASIITGALGKLAVDIDAKIATLVLVEGTAAVVAAAAGGAAAASFDGIPLASVSVKVSGAIF